MFFPEDFERKILHDSTSKVPYDNTPLIKIKTFNKNPTIHTPERKIGGSKSGVSTLKPAKLLHSSSMSGGCALGFTRFQRNHVAVAKETTLRSQKKPSAWQTIIKNTMKDKGMTMKEAIKHIKDNNLY